MDAAAAFFVVKGLMVLAGVAVFLRLLVKEYHRLAEMVAGHLAEAAAAQPRKSHSSAVPEPRVTLSPASDAHQQLP